jgi:hypothetical protein
MDRNKYFTYWQYCFCCKTKAIPFYDLWIHGHVAEFQIKCVNELDIYDVIIDKYTEQKKLSNKYFCFNITKHNLDFIALVHYIYCCYCLLVHYIYCCYCLLVHYIYCYAMKSKLCLVKTFPDKKKCFSSVLNLTQEQLVD